jgi:hypothetical protein
VAGAPLGARAARGPRHRAGAERAVTDDEILLRIARTLKEQIAPAVDGEYPRTQAFMAAVVLERVGRQLGRARSDAAAGAAEMEALVAELPPLLAGPMPPPVAGALQAVLASRDDAALCGLIEALYAARTELGPARVEAALGRIRRTLRASIDRRVEVAR